MATKSLTYSTSWKSEVPTLADKLKYWVPKVFRILLIIKECLEIGSLIVEAILEVI